MTQAFSYLCARCGKPLIRDDVEKKFRFFCQPPHAREFRALHGDQAADFFDAQMRAAITKTKPEIPTSDREFLLESGFNEEAHAAFRNAQEINGTYGHYGIVRLGLPEHKIERAVKAGDGTVIGSSISRGPLNCLSFDDLLRERKHSPRISKTERKKHLAEFHAARDKIDNQIHEDVERMVAENPEKFAKVLTGYKEAVNKAVASGKK